MITFEAWEIPHSETHESMEAEAFRFLGRRLQPGTSFPWRASWPTQWVGEVKPHTASGIAAGIRQLAKRPGTNKLLVTYRRKDDHSVEVIAAIAPNWDTWYLLGIRQFQWKRLVPLDSCRACLGSHIEGTVRAVVRGLAPALSTKRSAAKRGPDLSPEVAAELEFLHELIAELTTSR